uniref:RNA-directed DNA polymerase from mobile element jockey-like n=1 Tax=Saccoglossus kowalevskii TaxID=10224 RepID=A0ABM0M9N4_SACKO|nr:PREDICTED: RNA-directed DNA polymerase from mobile element jockey-like [Saccoglossus kowalevskii]
MSEIKTTLKRLKTGKSPGYDAIPAEMLKFSSPHIIAALHKLYNHVMEKGEYPEIWNINAITPVHKKDDSLNPNNYRGISTNSAIGKIFSMILNDRINQYLHDNDIIHKNQAGFRKKHRTTDYILTLHTMVKKYQSMNKPLYCSFIDLKKCFDTVWRSGLLYKLQANCLNGRLYNIIKSMYNNIKFYVKLDDKMTPAFQTDNGVKQGCPLSPTLFSLFINDLVELLDSTAIDQPVLDGLTISSLLFADDIVITSTSKEGLQSSINHLHDYTNK